MARRAVLIVESDPRVRVVIRQIFEAADYACELAADGREALQVFTTRRAPLVVTGLKMLGMTGIELLHQLRAVDDDVAVILLTDAADLKTAIESLKLGAYAFRMKPINAEEMLITAARALERRWLLIERRQHQQADGQLREADRTTPGQSDLGRRNVLILVVEEEREIRKLLQQIFDSAGYRCLLAGDAEEGLKVFRESRPSLVVTDLGMPMVRGASRYAMRASVCCWRSARRIRTRPSSSPAATRT